jgi:hypothetical protein
MRHPRSWLHVLLAPFIMVGSFAALQIIGSTTARAATGPIPVTRIYGTDATGTSIAASEAEFPSGGSARAVVLARSDFFSDALAGGPLAADLDGPLLITPGASQSSTLDPRVEAEIQRVLPLGDTVYILGGDLALSSGIDTELEGLGYQVVRLAGSDEYATAVDIAEQLGNPSTIFEATGLNFADALSAVPAAIREHAAILLTDGTTQAPETAAYLAQHSNDTRYAIGGPLAAYGADPTAIPVYGQDLYGTSAAVATMFFPDAAVFGAATGADFPDALSGGPFMGNAGGPMLLVEPSGPLPSTIESYLTGAPDLTQGYLFGGPLAVGDDVLSELESPGSTYVSITTSALPGGTVGTPYSATLEATGGTAPYSWTVISGSLPAGLNLASNGVITGTPTAQGTAGFTVQVVDSTTPTVETATEAMSIAIGAAAAASCTASMSNSTPADYTDDTVNITSNLPDEPVLITKYYRTTTSTDTGETDAGGSASITFDDSGATLGYTVQVDVSINDGQATCSTSFTPE